MDRWYALVPQVVGTLGAVAGKRAEIAGNHQVIAKAAELARLLVCR